MYAKNSPALINPLPTFIQNILYRDCWVVFETNELFLSTVIHDTVQFISLNGGLYRCHDSNLTKVHPTIGSPTSRFLIHTRR